MSEQKPTPTSTPAPRVGRTLNIVVNGLVAAAWLAGAIWFAINPNPFGRPGAGPITWVVIALLVIVSLMLISDATTAIRTRARSVEAVSGVLMWIGFLAGLIYYLNEFPGSNYLLALAALMVSLSFAVRVVMPLRKTAQAGK